MRLAQIIIILFFFLSINSSAKKPDFFKVEKQWVDSLMGNMSLKEKVGQLIMVTTYPSQGEANEQQIISYIKKHHIGGVLFLRNTPSQIIRSVKRYQSAAEVPLFMALDAENGLSFRLDSVIRYPHAMGLGALKNDSLIYRMGREVGQQLRTLGLNLNFAPVADVNSNPQNPIINYRSFGENPGRVAKKSLALAEGMMDEHIIVSAKHFPGHGDTQYDSHLTLPAVNRTYAQLDAIDFVPFKTVIDSGINGIMSAHISLPLVDDSGAPGTLSKRVMTEILRDSLGFEGLVFSDGMNMRGITRDYSEAEAAVKAIQAGVDVIEFVLNPGMVSNAIVDAVENGDLSAEMIDEKCRKILMAKKWTQTDQPVETDEWKKELNKGAYQLTSRYLYEKSLTVVENHQAFIPLKRLDTLRIASVAVGADGETPFQKMLEKYTAVDHYSLKSDVHIDELESLLEILKSYNLVIVSVHGTTLSVRNNFGVKPIHAEAVSQIIDKNPSILTFFSNPYSVELFNGVDMAESVIIAYGEDELYQQYAAQLVFGAIGADGFLPVSIGEKYDEGHGITVHPSGRLKYTIPEEVGVRSELLKSKIDSFARYGIKDTIFPGCQVLLAKDGKVFFHEPYGFFTYDSVVTLRKEHIYDWASMTKIVGPLPIFMKAVEDSLIHLDAPFSSHWPAFRNTDKAFFTFREVLAHQARLQPWIAFFLDTIMMDYQSRREIMKDHPTPGFSKRMSYSWYVNNSYKNYMFDEIKDSKLLSTNDYVYSGLAFYILPDLLEEVTGIDYEKNLRNNFLQPLGATTVMYNPYRSFKQSQIVPTEVDQYFRKELLQGFVHDEGAAMMGGVSGNAGLFGNTNDLAKIMQFYLQKGYYGDFNYLDSAIMNEFTRVQFPENENRRGLGFDKPYIDNHKKELKEAYPAVAVSENSFGHSGFTGTFAWADPESELLFIFMSNRVYPSRENTKLFDENFRPELQQAVYECLESFKTPNY
jgi:beta-N-acetylhexosaminidase